MANSPVGTTLGLVMAYAIAQLKSANIDNPELDAHWLIGHILRLDRADLMSQSERMLSDSELSSIQSIINRRLKHEPVARILGERAFWNLSFHLNEATLEPRPDSETLIEVALKRVQPAMSRILDLGTGTGCLLLSLLHERPNATGLGIDIAPRAVEQANENAKLLNLSQRAQFKVGNWLDNITEQFDIIISNPPYIASKDIMGLMPDVRDFDPPAALDGGDDGLTVYRFLIPQLQKFLKPNGFVLFEVGRGQADAVCALFVSAVFKNITKHKDFGGVERCITAY